MGEPRFAYNNRVEKQPQKSFFGRAFLVVSAFALAAVTYATVGGPTLIYDFRYNPADESVYYTEQDSGGRGCPPELFKLSLNSGSTTVVYSCDRGFAEDASPVSEIAAIVEGFKPLTPISLKKNSIEVDVDFVRAENYSPEFEEVVRRHFTATVHQRGNKVAELPITGCNLEQPFTFAGYAIPGFDKKIVLLLSTKGDCFEGGYTKETLHMVGGVGNLDKDFRYNSMKWGEALVPNEGTLVVFEVDSVGELGDGYGSPDPDDEPAAPDSGNGSDELEPEAERPVFAREEKSSTLPIALAVAVSLCVGLLLGMLLFRKPGAPTVV